MSLRTIKTSQIAYLDSSKLVSSRDTLLPEEDNRTPIQKWLDKVTHNLEVVRHDYYGERVPKFLHRKKIKIL